MTLYAWPRVGRAGLGNGLFPWARAELFAARTGARILAPRWTSLRIGPYLRREPDKRRYATYFHAPAHVHGAPRLRALALGRRIAESKADDVSDETGLRPAVVAFQGMGDLFAPLIGQQDFLHVRLWEMTAPHLHPNGQPYGEHFIAMHVRRGDLTRQGLSAERLMTVEPYTPLSWFVNKARAIPRAHPLHGAPIVVMTDGSIDEVEPLLAVEHVRLHPRGAAITDLMLMSQASLLMASGYSTFSMWASFFGGMPTVYAPGKIQQRLHARRDTEIELAEGEPLPAGFI